MPRCGSVLDAPRDRPEGLRRCVESPRRNISGRQRWMYLLPHLPQKRLEAGRPPTKIDPDYFVATLLVIGNRDGSRLGSARLVVPVKHKASPVRNQAPQGIRQSFAVD